jgi:hypothetical protein
MNHILPALLVQLLLSPFSWWAGALLAAGYYLGREMAQAECRIIQKFYEGERANMPWWGGFNPKAWNLKSMLDWLLPTVSGFMIAWIAS